jgi:hypothetical protein
MDRCAFKPHSTAEGLQVLGDVKFFSLVLLVSYIHDAFLKFDFYLFV